jgi:arabinofuranosyltransferase
MDLFHLSKETGPLPKNAIIALILIVYSVELMRTAWICDDSAITIRSVMNFIHGYGPTFNIDERVQAYTHPLWFLMISGFSTLLGNVFFSTLLLSCSMSLVALWFLITHYASNFWAGILASSALLLSKAYVDFSTSGLENPLSHVLLIALLTLGSKCTTKSRQSWHLIVFVLTVSLVYLNRPDLMLLVGPIFLLVIIKNLQDRITLVQALAIGGMPVLLWTGFSVFYYGFPFPNTAYAKLGVGIPLTELGQQGIRYFFDSIGRDPITLTFIALGLYIGFRSCLFNKILASGVLAYIIYIVSIGGCFMSGRLLTAPLFVAAAMVAKSALVSQQLIVLAIGFGILGSMNLNATLLSSSSYNNLVIGADGIADERGFYFQRFGLLNEKMEPFYRVPTWDVNERAVVVMCGGLGFFGIRGGPSIHLIDFCALADPLLARLPAKYTPYWRIGHFGRQLPTYYRESIEKNANLLADQQTWAYYESIRKITRGPLLSLDRLREIVRINLGLVDKPNWDMYRNHVVPRSTKKTNSKYLALRIII